MFLDMQESAFFDGTIEFPDFAYGVGLPRGVPGETSNLNGSLSSTAISIQASIGAGTGPKSILFPGS